MDVQKTGKVADGEFSFSTEKFGICDVSPAMLAALKGEAGPERRVEAKCEILRYMNKIGRVAFNDIAEVFLKRRSVRLFSLSPRDYVTPDNIEEWSENLSLFKDGDLPSEKIETIWLRLYREAEREFIQCGKNEQNRKTFDSRYRRALKLFFAAFKTDCNETMALKLLFPKRYSLTATEKVQQHIYDKETFEAVMSPMMEAMRTSGKFPYCEVYICRKMVEMHTLWGEDKNGWESRLYVSLSEYADPFKVTAVTSDLASFFDFNFLRWYLKIEQEISGQADLLAWLHGITRVIGSIGEVHENHLFEVYGQYARLLESGFKINGSEEEFNLLLSDLNEFTASVILMPKAATSPLGGLLAEAATAVIGSVRDELEEMMGSPEVIEPHRALERLRACMKESIRAEFDPVLMAASLEDAACMYQETANMAFPS